MTMRCTIGAAAAFLGAISAGLYLGMPFSLGADAKAGGPPEEMIEAFFAALDEGKAEEGFKNLLAGSLIEKDMAAVANLVEQAGKARLLYGKAAGHGQIRHTKVTDWLVGYEYLARHEKLPIRWWFRFYRGEEAWTVIEVNFNSNLDDLFGPPEKK